MIFIWYLWLIAWCLVAVIWFAGFGYLVLLDIFVCCLVIVRLFGVFWVFACVCCLFGSFCYDVLVIWVVDCLVVWDFDSVAWYFCLPLELTFV